jgi:hypothetical protein
MPIEYPASECNAGQQSDKTTNSLKNVHARFLRQCQAKAKAISEGIRLPVRWPAAYALRCWTWKTAQIHSIIRIIPAMLKIIPRHIRAM